MFVQAQDLPVQTPPYHQEEDDDHWCNLLHHQTPRLLFFQNRSLPHCFQPRYLHQKPHLLCKYSQVEGRSEGAGLGPSVGAKGRWSSHQGARRRRSTGGGKSWSLWGFTNTNTNYLVEERVGGKEKPMAFGVWKSLLLITNPIYFQTILVCVICQHLWKSAQVILNNSSGGKFIGGIAGTFIGAVLGDVGKVIKVSRPFPKLWLLL